MVFDIFAALAIFSVVAVVVVVAAAADAVVVVGIKHP